MLATGLVSFLVARVSRLVLPAINVFYIRSREDFHMFTPRHIQRSTILQQLHTITFLCGKLKLHCW